MGDHHTIAVHNDTYIQCQCYRDRLYDAYRMRLLELESVTRSRTLRGRPLRDLSILPDQTT